MSLRLVLVAGCLVLAILSVAAGDPPEPGPEVRADLVEGAAVSGRLLTSPISGEIGKVVEETFGVDTFQLTPLVSDPSQLSSRFSPSARLTIGKHISTRAYITFSRSITGTSDQIILLEYDQSDRTSWVLTRNEDDSYALDFRVRKEF